MGVRFELGDEHSWRLLLWPAGTFDEWGGRQVCYRVSEELPRFFTGSGKVK